MNKQEIENRLKENKAEKKDLKKQLAELPKFEVGKWYNISAGIAFKIGDDYVNYGICRDEWRNDLLIDEYIVTGEATETEVFEALKNEAIKRGFKEGIEFERSWDARKQTINSTKPYYYSSSFTALNFGGSHVFKNGIWATIIKEPTIELNGEYNIEQLENEIVKLKNK
jgi:hypothetical protein